MDKIPAPVLEELTRAGFVEVRSQGGKKSSDRVFAVEDSGDFASRIRGLGRYHLLDPDQPSMVTTYFNACYYPSDFLAIVTRVLRKVGIDESFRIEDALKDYVLTHHWPDWVVPTLDDSLAERILTLVRQAEGPLLLSELPGRIAGRSPDQVRSSLDKLIAHLVLVEDLDPRTLELRVGLLPSVRAQLVRASQPRPRPPLVVCAAPTDFGPDEGVLVGDLRAFLLEVASEPPRLRQDRLLFQKETERFREVLEPLPSRLAEVLKLNPEGRVGQAHGWAKHLKLVHEVGAGKQVHLHLQPKGQRWLTASIDDQLAELIGAFRAPTTHADLYSPDRQLFLSGLDSYGYYSSTDLRFLGVNVAALRPAKGGRQISLWEAKSKDFEPLREALDRVFSALPDGVYHRLDSLVEHAAFGEYNPLLLGEALSPGRVMVYLSGRPLPPLQERLDEAGRLLIDEFVRRRLIPLGCVRAALDDKGRLCVAREPSLDAYFGRGVTPRTRAPGSQSEASRVVVQPDFSVVIIGPSPAPAAELIPFCERASRGAGRGALVLKITREAVIKAVAQGLKPTEILARLRRHASHEVPANVLREVEGWAGWVRHVSPETLTVLRCPDRETADRVMAVLRKQAERIQDMLVAIEPKNLTAVERHKLRDQGILLGSIVSAAEPKPKAKKKRRRYY